MHDVRRDGAGSRRHHGGCSRQPAIEYHFLCCNTESNSSEAGRAGGLHWTSAVFEVIALGIARRDGQQAAGSTRQERHREIRARKRQRGDTERPVDCDLASEEETKGSEVDSEEMDFDSD